MRRECRTPGCYMAGTVVTTDTENCLGCDNRMYSREEQIKDFLEGYEDRKKRSQEEMLDTVFDIMERKGK
jgi:hypothetical protein